MHIKEFINWCDNLLNTKMIIDYAPNGLQVEGTKDINKIVTSVSASLESIEFSIKNNANLLLVHHGMFWKSEFLPIISWKKERIKKLLLNDINLVAYHLPLDINTPYGNNAQIAKLFNWKIITQLGPNNCIFLGETTKTKTLQEINEEITEKLTRKPLVIGNENKIINKIMWCSGAAQNFFQYAIDYEVDLYLTGEASEANFHLAKENNVAFVSAGHHATETLGICALSDLIRKELKIETVFFNDKNPI